MSGDPLISVVMSVFNDAQHVATALDSVLSQEAVDLEFIVIDDGSTDGTGQILDGYAARDPRLRVIHQENSGLTRSLIRGCNQARGKYIARQDGGGAGGIFRRVGNAFYNRLATYLSNQKVLDLTSGFRGAWRDKMLEFLPLFPNGFSYPTTSTLAFIKAGYNVGFVPIQASKRVGKSKIRLFRDGTKFVVIALRMIVLFSPMRVFLPASLLMFAGGAAHGIYTIVTETDITDLTVLLVTMSVITFFIGLISEQIALMRFERLQK